MSDGSELTTCEDCNNDLAAEGGVTVYYRFGMPGSLDAEGMALPHAMEAMLAAAKDATQDAVVCANCGNPIWEE